MRTFHFDFFLKSVLTGGGPKLPFALSLLFVKRYAAGFPRSKSHKHIGATFETVQPGDVHEAARRGGGLSSTK